VEFGFNSRCYCEEDRISAVAASTNSMSVGRSVIRRLAGAGPPTGARPRDVITSLAAAGADRHSSRRRFHMARSASGHYRVRRTAGSNRTIVVVVVVLMKSDAPRTNPPPRPETTLQSTWEVIRWRTQDFKLKGH